jgi:hypothetical protein
MNTSKGKEGVMQQNGQEQQEHGGSLPEMLARSFSIQNIFFIHNK